MSPERTINNYRHREGSKSFRFIPNSLKSETHLSDRLCLCDWFENWTIEGFLYLMNFMLGPICRPDYQNGRI